MRSQCSIRLIALMRGAGTYRDRAMMRYMQLLLALMFLLCGAALDHPATAAQAGRGPLFVVEAQGTVTSVTIGYLQRALHLAEASDASALIIKLESGGGVLRDIRP